MKLRPYQLKAVVAAREAFRTHKAVCLCLPVGSGKTVIASECARLVTERGGRTLFLVHRRELVEQAKARLQAHGVEAGIIMAGEDETPEAPVQVASIPTLIRRKERPPADLVVFDECHHTPSESWERLAKHYSDSWRLGLTATPFRLDGKGIGRVFTELVQPITICELIDMGHLVAPKVYSAPPPALDGIRKRGGDYSDLELLGERMAALTGDIIEHWVRHANGQRTVVFAVNIKHSRYLAEQFAEAGVRVEHIDAKISRDERGLVLGDLERGDVTVVTNCMILTEGWDLPTLQCAIIARPTMSLALHHQMIGRVMRPPGPVVVLDHAGNHYQHGAITAGFEASLHDRVKQKPGTEPLTRCDGCWLMLNASIATCPECGEELRGPSETQLPKTADGELREFVYIDKEDPGRVYRNLLTIASIREFSVGWARHAFKGQFGYWPRYYSLEAELYTCPGHTLSENQWGALVCTKCRKTIRRPVRR